VLAFNKKFGFGVAKKIKLNKAIKTIKMQVKSIKSMLAMEDLQQEKSVLQLIPSSTRKS